MIRLVVISILGLAVFTGCEKEQVNEKTRLRSVKYIEIFAAGSGLARTFSGIARGSQEIKLSFKSAGTLASIPVKLGDRVKKGQLLAELDSAQHELQVQQSRASLAQARASLRNAGAVYQRLKGLYENNNASRQELDAARSNAESSQAQLNVAVKSLELAKLNLSYTRLVTDNTCDVTAVNVENNENVSSGQSIIKLSCGDHIDIAMNVPATYVNQLKPGMLASVKLSIFPDTSFTAKITEIGVAADGGTTFPVLLAIDNSPAQLKSGMVAEVTFIFEHSDPKQSTIVIPSVAVSEDLNGRFVYLVDANPDNKTGVIKRQQITIGHLMDQGIQITSGLKLGHKVVVAGVTAIREGLQVRID